MQRINILKKQSFNDDKVAIMVLFETKTTKEIRIMFKEGQMMKKHQTPYPITVEIVKGELDFGVEDEVYNLIKGDLVALEGAVAHDLTAKTDCIVRLTLSKLDSVSRVKNVVSLSQ